MSNHHIRITINGTLYKDDVDARMLLVHWIRDSLHLTGTHIGCDTTSCGACTILVDGKATKSCTMFAVRADGRQIQTVEGLEQQGKLHPIQEGFYQKHGLHCGYCTPGMMMTAIALLSRNPNPTEQEIREGISGNLCRCTGYVNIVKAKFTLDVTRPEKHEPDLMVVKGRGKAPGSTVDLSGRMNLSAIDAEHTRMDWTAQVTVSGTIASIGARLLHQTAEKLTEQFFDCLKAKLQTSETASAGG